MGSGRPRKQNPAIPKHIDQSKLPRGIYWSNRGKGRWYVFVDDPDGPRNTKVVAGPTAKLSDLHVIMEQRAGKDPRGTIAHAAKQFEESTDFAALSANTKRDYIYCAGVARKYETKVGPLSSLQIDRLTLPFIQGVVEKIAKGRPESKVGANDGEKGYPTKANHLARYLSAMFAWGRRHGYCTTNPAEGVKLAKERKRHGMPTKDVHSKILEFARERGALQPHTRGSCPAYLWPLLQVKYLCRMRGIEVVKLTDAHATERGLYIKRTKGSSDNIVAWTPTLRTAWEVALSVRATTLARPSNRARPIPIRPEDRFIFLTESGTRLSVDAMEAAWQELMRSVIAAGVITAEERPTLHGFKHRGVTDTKGKKADKQAASGHKSAAMLDLYDHEVAVVQPAESGE